MRYLILAALLSMSARQSFGYANAYIIGPVISTNTGTATETIAGSFKLAASSVTVSTPTITLSGSNGISTTKPVTLTSSITVNTNIGISTGGIVYFGTHTYIHNNTSQIGARGKNFFAGEDAGNLNLSAVSNGGSGNTGIGQKALNSCSASGGVSSCIDNVAIGNLALSTNTTGWENVAIGWNAMVFNTGGSQNMALGGLSMYYNTTGSSNTAIGDSALYQNTTGGNNTAIGWSSMSGYVPSTNDASTALGSVSMFNSIFAQQDVALGYAALYSNITGGANVAAGRDALYNSLNDGNTGIGHKSLRSDTTGAYNVAVGYLSGDTDMTINANVLGSSNTFIGTHSGPGTATQIARATAIGAGAKVSQSNALVLGSTSPVTNVGIGTVTPSTSTILDLAGGLGLQSRTIAQLLLIQPLARIVYFCSDCSPAKIVVGTGSSAGNFADAVGGTFK